MKFESTIDLVKVYANIDQSLLNSSANLESAIAAFGAAAAEAAGLTIEYRKEKARIFSKLHKEKIPATIIKEITAGETADLKGDVLKAEAKKKECQMWINAFEHRINTLKFIGKKTAPMTGDYNK